MNDVFHVNMEMLQKCLMNNKTICNHLNQSAYSGAAGTLCHGLPWTALGRRHATKLSCDLEGTCSLKEEIRPGKGFVI